MKYFIAGLLLLFTSLLVIAEAPRTLWVTREYEEHNDRVLLIRDNETGTRCYAITNSEVNVAGYAIACVPKGAK